MNQKKLGFWLLAALVAGNMVGSAIFMLPQSLANVGSPAGILLAWLFTGLGVLMIAHVYGQLSDFKPALLGGPPSYTRELFNGKSKLGQIMGFEIAWGYWTSNSPGNAAILITLVGYLTYFLPVLQSKAILFSVGGFHVQTGNFFSFAIASLVLWFVHYLMLKGTYAAGKINFVATVAKILGFLFFIVVALSIFDTTYLHPFIAAKTLASGKTIGLFQQMNRGAILTLWAFVGIESAAWLSGRAKRQRDVKSATLTGLLIALIIYLLITFLAMGTLPAKELMVADKPLVDVLTKIIGPKGSFVMATLGVLSMLGATVGWILLSVEVPYQSARLNLFPHWFVKENKNGAPYRAAWITNGLTQVFLLSMISNTIANAFNEMVIIATLANLVPYLFSGLYSLNVVGKGENYETVSLRKRLLDGTMALGATLYSFWVLKSGLSDLKTLALGMLLFVSGLVLLPLLPKHDAPEEQAHLETPVESLPD
ncbi:Amino acid/polyamine transporter I [Acididesulfobacillus acetoxydans]|uniref:Amino acid/polyamine transporter I n=1 Tax=Acididesulfobacillus acetoxydans TaxID=1561005 RepID=A0A8S0Y028_9FIRM|nr:amino acid permease [Acididesulfobacillus acetoxydans]CAA7602767.1 Amino acid/polyamine transporter I [Acididesulfobacillus acetoxydans]CEJ06376.1 Arginine/ornithine antiporter [Acididesulfobacillus acetoxydans]